MSEDLARIQALLVDFEEDELLEAVGICLSSGDEPMAVVEACRDGMEEVGRRFAAGEFFVNELICSADLFGRVMEILGPRLSAEGNRATKGKVVIGTVRGDVHDIGKDIVVAMLRCNGFEVYDLGVNIPAQQFVDKVRETGAKVVGLSGLLTLAFDGMEETVRALKAAGLDAKVMIGGGMTNEMVRAKVGADACGQDAIEAVRLAKSFLGVS